MQKQWLQGASAGHAKFQPQCEELQSRIVPAGLLAGHGQGAYVADAVQSGAGLQYQLTGNADLQGLGHFAVAGSLHGVGFIQQGHAGGMLTFTNAHGSLTVELTGPTQNAFAPLPNLFNERIIGGTGAYQHLSGHEKAQLDLWPVDDAGNPNPHGSFTLIEEVARAVPPLHGHGTGTVTREFGIPDLGAIIDVHGTADLAALGHVSVEGSVRGVGNISQGHATGTLTFTNAHGSVTVALEGPVQSAFSPLPQHFHYSVVGSSGDYAGLTAEGTLNFAVVGTPGHEKFALSV